MGVFATPRETKCYTKEILCLFYVMREQSDQSALLVLSYLLLYFECSVIQEYYGRIFLTKSM